LEGFGAPSNEIFETCRKNGTSILLHSNNSAEAAPFSRNFQARAYQIASGADFALPVQFVAAPVG
jgi:hypothetical protein